MPASIEQLREPVAVNREQLLHLYYASEDATIFDEDPIVECIATEPHPLGRKDPPRLAWRRRPFFRKDPIDRHFTLLFDTGVAAEAQAPRRAEEVHAGKVTSSELAHMRNDPDAARAPEVGKPHRPGSLET